MKTKAKVVSLMGEIAEVESARTSACEGCHKAQEENGCSVCSLMGANRMIRAKAKNTVGAQLGDDVWIESNTSRMLWYAALVFLLPILLTLIGFGIAALFTASLGLRVAGGAVGFVISFVAVIIYSKAVEKTRCDIEITGVIASASDPDEKKEEPIS
jgi:positive regulator of sigma E activity